ncbi:Oxoglutarate/iron-dependent dioxygenase [Parasponia andersonii]|uniref:Oxoglutarate/iron-dependent dioxygenase n=1 Tax=Parasponia andersonii TaxID=3476 RepID=A0A2P5CZ88_PARAD|nr:Oxoglutarate/iron-dependent dioxygenase [Parasponia andersonii]
MGVKPQHKIPTINLSKRNLISGTSSWLSTCDEIRQALEEYGCFLAIYDKVSPQLYESIFGEAKELFDLPTDIKMKNISDKPYFGYIGKHALIPPLHESLGIANSTTLEAAQSFTNLMWPSSRNDHFCETVLSYARRVSELEKMGVAEKYYDSHLGSTTFLLRLFKYRIPEINESDIGCSVHTDKSFLTILHQNEVNGLEIETKDGDWIGFEPLPSSFLVMAGDAFLAWSNGRIYSAPHRVVMSGTKPRYSLGLFSYHDGTIEIPHELIDEQHPLQFRSFDHYGLLNYFSTAPNAESTAKAYCGFSYLNPQRLLYLSGILTNNFLAPTMVANFLKTQITINRVKIFVNANPNILNVFPNTRIIIEIVGLKDPRSSRSYLYHTLVLGGACPMPLIIDEDEPLE